MHVGRIPNRIFQWDSTLSEKYKKTWYNELKSVMEKCELLELFNNNYTNGLSVKFIANYSELLLRQKHHDKWKLDIVNMPKLRTFRCLETNFETQQYITTNMTRQQRSTLARMRCGTFPLELELGRYRGIPSNRRFCKVCNDNVSVEDEKHFLIKCPLYSCERNNAFADFQQRNNIDLSVLSDDEILIKLLTTDWLLGSGKSQMSLKYACEFKENNALSIVWKLNFKDLTSLQTSLKYFCTIHDIRVEMDESKPPQAFIEDLGQAILQILTSRKEAIHLLILDDLLQDSCRCLQNFIRECRTHQHIQIIITTFQPLFDDCKIIDINGFTSEEAVDFLSGGIEPTNEDKDEYIKLGFKYGFLPLGLYCARTYMHHTSISPGKFNKLCETKELRKIEDNHFHRCSRKCGDSKGFLQYLEIEEIPLLLFDFFGSDSPETNYAIETNNFIQALRKFSFGKIEGKDDDRVLSTHYAVVSALKIFSKQQKEVLNTKFQTKDNILLKQLLRAFMHVMDKDNRSKTDFRRNKMMVQHARSALIHADELFKKDQTLRQDLEFLMSVIYVHDLVGYTYNFDGILNVAAHHSDMSKSYWFVLLNVDQEAFENDLKDECGRVESIDMLDRFCQEKAKHLFDKMKCMASENAVKLENFAKCYILEQTEQKMIYQHFKFRKRS
ncbi:unnamed protein product [Mytilus edulis]|uniref:Uncharacterized protein n=1 Tax=Mytilus edulis TaxID=6550 RepID=A0A8S3TDM4_MYTED|nr:unnamed protein product [Mytilus edulis]